MTLPRALMISLQKSGTHLLSGLAEKIGYQVIGTVVGPQPVFPRSEDDRVLSLFCSEDEFKALESDETARQAKLQQTFTWLSVSWNMRTGTPITSRHAMSSLYAINDSPDIRKLMNLPFTSLHEGVCWIKHELPLHRSDGQFLTQWMENGEPRVIFNYRDPRDVLISFVNYLTKQTQQKTFGKFGEYLVYYHILSQLPDMESRLKYAILDPSFPGHRDFEESLWLYSHPMVCKVSFEELVGSQGGGNDQKREEAVARILRHVDCDMDPQEVSNGLFNSSSFTFNRGQIGVWREVFSDDLHRAFNKRFGDITEAYGYELYVP